MTKLQQDLLTKLKKDYEKEWQIQAALGTLGKFCVSRPNSIGKHNDLFLMPKVDNEWFISCEVFNVVNVEHAIDMIMEKYSFPENARKHLSAKRMLYE